MASAALDANAGGSGSGAQPRRNADLGAWLAVAAGTMGALMATLDISIVNSALPTIQGELGATGTEGAWVATAYLVAEIVIIPLSAWLERMLGLRTFLLIAVTLFTIFSVICGLSTSLSMMVFGRVGQGFTGGALIPTAQTIIAQRLPRHQQSIGTAAFGIVAILGPLLGPLVGGWLTESVSWHYAFFLNVPISAVLLTLLFVGLPAEKSRLHLIREADWFGIAGLALGLGGLTVFLEEGAREEWFASELIRYMAATTVVGFGLLFWGQATARRPVIKLSLLLDRQFGAVATMGIALGVVLYGTSYAIPQFLAAIADYNALQSGKVVLLSGIPSILMMPFVPILIRKVDIRLAVGFGMLIMGFSAYLETSLTIQSTGGDFTESQLMRGLGTILGMLFLSQACVQSVPPEDAGDASGLFNAMRNLGGSFALAGISILQQNRVWLHSRRIEESLHANDPAVQDYVSSMGRMLGSPEAGLRVLGQTIQGQALTMTYNDIFFAMSVVTVLVFPLVFLLKPLPKDASAGAMH
ncbi:MDR family MFS transporter [Novosphingobium mangrovi (ex Hu et al. 2023)]|uniref:Multidrug efflux MFS transporter n=1 Tax=Novosphingobium mangrovi (ex Hu et al. 2023) TaxID=2930094 RepID=A0ABT0AIE3_9SPHN|nr:MDR family MFS transporter [Novosphingobium mangrovi (ex Hu et al. 2023)]MCJ1962933.1 multidrug efflux MFS transporter [Novosphingobium mangrovi (ex Hu et al. 2023)]